MNDSERAAMLGRLFSAMSRSRDRELVGEINRSIRFWGGSQKLSAQQVEEYLAELALAEEVYDVKCGDCDRRIAKCAC